MRFALMAEPQQGLAYVEILALARAAETAGFEAFLRSDHYASFPGPSDLPTTDAWATLAGLARDTERIRLGSLVSPVTFRAPGELAKVAATVDEMSGGRIEVGLGAGWNELEHRRHGFAFPDLKTRFDMLEEQLAIVHGLWTGGPGWSYPGRFWQVDGAHFVPLPTGGPRGRHPRIIVGGSAGGPRTARLAATYADEYNHSRAEVDGARAAFEGVRRACLDRGRDPDELACSVLVPAVVAPTEAGVEERVRALVAAVGEDAEAGRAWLEERRDRMIVGTIEQAAGQIALYERAGAGRIAFQDLLPRDLDHVRDLGALARAYGQG
jgi:F420-dependent oxidoreductase-like protein